MNVFGCIIFMIAGVLAITLTRFFNKQDMEDYSKCSTAMGIVSHTHDFGGERWLVDFRDATGREVMGLDDVIADSSFSPKYRRPSFGSEERVYYYPISENCRYSINGKRIEYNIHFCNDDLYELHRHVTKRNCVAGLLLGIALFICAFLILIWGYR